MFNAIEGLRLFQTRILLCHNLHADRVQRFGDVKNGTMIFNDAGEMVDAEWNLIPERYDHVVLDTYQIMPNHVHGILQITFLANGMHTVGRGLVPCVLV